MRRKVILHQTRKKIDRLVSEGRTGGRQELDYTNSQLDGYDALFSAIYRRTGELPGLDPALTDLPLVYSEQIHYLWPSGEALTECKEAGLTIKKVFSDSRHKPQWY